MMRQKLMQNVIKDLMKVPMKPKGPGSLPHDAPKSTTIAITEHGHGSAGAPMSLPGEEDPEHEAEEAMHPAMHEEPDYDDEEIDLSPKNHAESALQNKKLHAMGGHKR